MAIDGTPGATAVSRDGTRIGYRVFGSGPGIVLLQGAGADATHYAELAEALAPRFTVVLPDRRGRGGSPKPFDPGHRIERDVEDVAAVLEATGAETVFGLSSGAMIALEAGRTLPAVRRLAVYEPPFLPGGLPPEGVRRIVSAVARGDLATALATALRISGTAPPPLRVLPAPAARLLAAVALRIDALVARGGTRLRDLAPGLPYDFADVSSRDTRMADFAAIDVPVLLLSGTASPAYLQQGVRDLERLLPHARRVVLEGLGHSGPWNRRRGGRPEAVAAALVEGLR